MKIKFFTGQFTIFEFQDSSYSLLNEGLVKFFNTLDKFYIYYNIYIIIHTPPHTHTYPHTQN